MKTSIEKLVADFIGNATKEIMCMSDLTLLNGANGWVDVYNKYQELERDGVDYLFRIDYVDDVKCCLDGGMTISEIVRLHNNVQQGIMTPYFFFGTNYRAPYQLIAASNLKIILVYALEQIVPHILANPDRYPIIYARYITAHLYNLEML